MFGSNLFNATYAEALSEVLGGLSSASITLRRSYRERPFWSSVSLCNAVYIEDVLDVTFVDDECLVIFAKSPFSLLRNAELLLGILTDVFHKFQLNINWSPGKSECFLILCGKKAAEAYASVRSD